MRTVIKVAHQEPRITAKNHESNVKNIDAHQIAKANPSAQGKGEGNNSPTKQRRDGSEKN